MNEAYSNIIARLVPLYDMAPQRFMAFYNAVYLMCIDLPEGDLALFRDIVKTLIAEQPYNKYMGQLELSDDMEYVRRTTGFKPSANRFIPRQGKR